MVTTWYVLILTLATAEGVFIKEIEPFMSKDMCEAAGKQWVDKTYFYGAPTRGLVRSNYVCVLKK